MKSNLITFILSILFSPSIFGQYYSETSLRTKLDSIGVQFPGYNNEVQISVSALPIAELINSVALENNLNISIDPMINQAISYNFFNAKVKDVLVFVYTKFEVEYEFIGSILSITKRSIKKEIVIPRKEKVLDIRYNAANEFLSVDLKNDSLSQVMKEITKQSGNNIVLAPDIRDKPISAYFLNRPFDQVFQMLALANGLESKKDENGFYYLFTQKVNDKIANNATTSGFKPNTTSYEQTGVQLNKNKFGTLDITANNAEIVDVLKMGADQCGAHYFLYSKPEGRVSFDVKNSTFPELLQLIFNGTKYSYKEKDQVFLIGENRSEGLRSTELIRMENRTIENVKAAIPSALMIELEINEFLDLNGLVVSGSKRKIDELKEFLSTIDIVVPMVQIDVMIVFSKRGSTMQSGIKAGIKDKPTTTSGTVFPTTDVQLGSQALNSILDAINGFGIINLGNVTENFYLSLKLLESNNVVSIESTPKVTTLNGHNATLSIGETTYYQETQVNVQNSVVNQGVLSSKTWKSIDANLTIKIKPFVSADENVTLSITVTQDDFGSKVDPSAPPNISKQNFESVVRVKNGELVLLGGLDKKRNNDAGSGVPFLSRIPVIKWFFSSREKEKEKSKLHIIIRPTVTY
jgi:type IV pilus assembly protein PilQ